MTMLGDIPALLLTPCPCYLQIILNGLGVMRQYEIGLEIKNKNKV